ncbi:hypothetical protein BKA64DRAFT_679066 [Cadophora sp. MPI-SDFR-AT-0126]|nr:hypothetical protein BKA64DRAFT_679066 [Leotiomycetes sp. MPI-SDFR-AT-0126]
MPHIRVSLQLIARKGTTTGWAVDVIVNGTRVLREVPVADPLTMDQTLTCRWYLEQYLQRSPFSLEKAKEAELLLARYPEDLLRQLPLRDVLFSRLANVQNFDSYSVHVDIIQEVDKSQTYDDGDGNIHRLFWETLEDPKLWNHPNWDVVVQRAVVTSIRDVSPVCAPVGSWDRPSGMTTFNVLLVIARDTTEQPSIYSDIDPFLATDALVKIRKRLGSMYNPIRLNLEIVRPGTFFGFKEHLRRAEETHGPGYFHLVHFDMHGKVGTRKGKVSKYGFLYFSHPTSEKTAPEPGLKVAKVLEQYKIPLVVLNSCESARASCGDDANIASSFINRGVRGVLGMSFKLSKGAAILFLESFYHDLLVNGSSFSGAAAAGRKALRSDPARPARYGLQRDLKDSFVAVAYGLGSDAVITEAVADDLRPGRVSRYRREEMDNYFPSPATPRLLGRDFDLLRLEKRLSRVSIIHLYGTAGVGKTSFLDYAASVWKSTNFADAIVIIEFGRDIILSAEEISPTMIRQILSQVNCPKHQSRLWTMPSRSLQSYDNSMVEEIIRDILCEMDLVIIFDSLDILFAPYPSFLVPGSVAKDEKFDIYQKIKPFFLWAENANRNKKCRIIFTSRCVNMDWLVEFTGPQYELSPYELRRLGLSDAIELSQLVLAAAGEDVKEWAYEDTDWLECIIELLQGIPSALLHVLPLQRTLKVNWPDFYTCLQNGLFTSCAELGQVPLGISRFAQELHSLSTAFRPGHFFFLCLLSSYWHFGVSLHELSLLFLGTADEALKRDFDSPAWASALVEFAQYMGYIRVDQKKTLLWIHPLLTIIGRAYLSEFVTARSRVNLKRFFCATMERIHIQSREGETNHIAQNGNILTCIEYCLANVPPAGWPLNLLSIYSSQVCSMLPLPLRISLQEKKLQLLMNLSETFPRLGKKEKFASFFSIVLLHVSLDSENYSDQILERIVALSTKGLALIESLDEPEVTGDVALYRGCLLLSRITSSLSLGDHVEAQNSLQLLKPLKDEVIGNCSSVAPLLSNLHQILSQPGEMSGIKFITPKQKETVEEMIAASKTTGLDGIRILLASFFQNIQQLEAKLLQETTGSPPSRTPKRKPEWKSFAQQTLEQRPEIDIEQYKAAIGWKRPKLTQATLVEANTHRQHDDTLEEAYDTGDWLRALETHKSLVFEALKSHHFEEAEEHLESIKTIFSKTSFPSKYIEEFDEFRRELHNLHREHLFHQAFYPSTSGDSFINVHHISDTSEPLELDKVLPANSVITGGEFTMANLQEMKNSSKKWWEWWHILSSQDSRLIAHIYENVDRYAEEAGLLEQIHKQYTSLDFEGAFSKLDILEALCRDDSLAQYIGDYSPLQGVRDCFEVAVKQFSLFGEWSKALEKDEFEAARAIIDQLSVSLRPAFFDWLSDNDIEMMRKVGDREQLNYFSIGLHKVPTAGQLEAYGDLYRAFLDTFAWDAAASLNPDELFGLKSLALEQLMQGYAGQKIWGTCISYCEEYLTLTQPRMKEFPRIQHDCLNIRDQCEWGLIQESLGVAEIDMDFERCLRLLDEMEVVYRRQNATRGILRQTFFILGEKEMSFLKGAYSDRCMGCAQFVRQRAQVPCRLKEGRGPNHDRRIFRRPPFGCAHHCKGEYCFLA